MVKISLFSPFFLGQNRDSWQVHVCLCCLGIKSKSFSFHWYVSCIIYATHQQSTICACRKMPTLWEHQWSCLGPHRSRPVRSGTGDRHRTGAGWPRPGNLRAADSRCLPRRWWLQSRQGGTLEGSSDIVGYLGNRQWNKRIKQFNSAQIGYDIIAWDHTNVRFLQFCIITSTY